MKLVLLKGEHDGPDEEGFWNLALYNSDDVIKYFDVKMNKVSDESAKAWFGVVKGQEKFLEPGEYTATERIANMLLSTLKNGESMSMNDYSLKMGSIQTSVMNSMLKHVDKGTPVRVNSAGGYCPLSVFTVLDQVDIKEREELVRFVYNGKVPMKLEDKEWS